MSEECPANRPDKAEQWLSITQFLRSAGVQNQRFCDFEKFVPIDWATSRLGDPLGDYINTTWEGISSARGVGKKKLDQLFQNLRAIACYLGWQVEGKLPDRALDEAMEPEIILTELLGLPANFPVYASFFSERVREFCSNANLATIADLVRFTREPDWQVRATAYPNVGNRSRDEIASFAWAFDRQKKQKLQEYLPIRLEGAGIDLGLIALRVANQHESIGLDGLLRRLVHGETLEAVAHAKRLTRERVRQIEAALESRIEEAFTADPPLRQELWDGWLSTGEVASVDSEQGTDAERLAVAMVKKIFAGSDEGKAVLADREARCRATFELLRDEPSFYSGELVLAAYLQARPELASIRHLLEWNRDIGAFLYDEETSRVRAARPRTKHVVAALLKSGDVTAAEVLAFLRKLNLHVDWDEPNLKRNYLQWKKDTDFSAFDLIFTSNTVEEGPRTLRKRPTPRADQRDDGGDSAVRAPAVRVEQQQELGLEERLGARLVGANVARLVETEESLRAILASVADSQPLFGLLPVAQAVQEESVRSITEAIRGDFTRLMICLREFPCLTGYVLAVGPGSTIEGLDFFEPFELFLGLSIPPQRREELAEAFRQASQQLGLLPIPIPARERADYVWPFIFQAAIIPRFVDPLIEAILRELKDGIPPDLESSDAVALFSRRIVERINPGQRRLRRVLSSEAGASVTRLLLNGYLTGDFSAMPPHLEKRCQETFREVHPQQRYALSSAYVALDYFAGELTLVLPRQSARLLLPGTLWTIDPDHRFQADVETRIPVDDLNKGALVAVLAPLRHSTIRRWETKIEVLPTEENPVWLFDASTGRRAQFKADHVGGIDELRLPSGRDFAILTLQRVHSDLAEEAWKPLRHDLKVLRYETFWGQEVVSLSLGERRWRISCREEPCVLLAPKAGGRLRTVDGEEIIFGTGLAATLVAPPEREVRGESSQVRVRSSSEQVFAGTDEEIEDSIGKHVAALPGGLHFLDVEFRSGRRTARRKTWFWKGLDYIDSSFGFRCSASPENIRWEECEGVVRDNSGVRVLPKWSYSEVVVATEHPAMRLRLRRPGLSLAILDPTIGVEEPGELRTTLVVAPNDARRLLVRLEGSGKWTIQTGTSVVARTDDGSLKVALRLGDLVSDGASTARVTAHNGDNAPVVLLRLHRQLAVGGFDVLPDSVNNRYFIRFVVPTEVKCLGFARRLLPPSDRQTITEIPLAANARAEGIAGLPGGVATVKEAFGGGLLVEVFLPYECLNNDWHVLELFHRQHPTEEWSPLSVADNSGMYGSRCVLSPVGLRPDPCSNFARKVLLLAENRSDPTAPRLESPEIPDDTRQIHEAFECLEYLLDYRYSRAGWESAKWARAGFIWLTKHTQEVKPDVLAQRAVRALAERSNAAETFRPMHFGSAELLCAVPSRMFKLPAFPTGEIGDCFALIAKRSDVPSTVALLSARETDLSTWPFAHFGNFALAATGRAERFRNLNVPDLLVDLGQRIDQFSVHGPEEEGLLSSAHWAKAYAAFERRFRRIRMSDDSGSGPRNSLARIDANVRHLELAVKQAFGLPLGVDLEWLALSGSELSRTVLRVVFWTAALGRMSAYGWKSSEEFRSVLMRTFDDGSGDLTCVRKGVSLCIGLSPEWFAASMLLWELSVADLTQPA